MKRISMTLLFATAVVLIAACSDNTAAPNARAADSKLVFGGGYTAALMQGDTARFSITIDPYQNTYYALGDGNSPTFPAGSVCDPTSTYGVTEWDQPCAPMSNTVTVNVTEWLDSAGHARADFQPHLRFVPSAIATNWVQITFADLQASLSAWPILYCPTDVSSCYDESKTDLSLITVSNAVNGHVTRRIKHFSGYMVGAGDDSSASGFNLKPAGGHLPISSVLGRP